jgi:hypothetical protein
MLSFKSLYFYKTDRITSSETVRTRLVVLHAHLERVAEHFCVV